MHVKLVHRTVIRSDRKKTNVTKSCKWQEVVEIHALPKWHQEDQVPSQSNSSHSSFKNVWIFCDELFHYYMYFFRFLLFSYFIIFHFFHVTFTVKLNRKFSTKIQYKNSVQKHLSKTHTFPCYRKLFSDSLIKYF